MKVAVPVRIFMLLVVVAFTAGCSSGVSGDYGGDQCVYEKLSFRGDGKAYITYMGIEKPAQYTVDGDKVSLTADGQGIVFTRKGDTLEGGNFMGRTIVCQKQ